MGPWPIALLVAAGLAGGVAARRAPLAAPPLSAGAAAAEASIIDSDLRTALRTLASDEMAGRGVGHTGNEEAARYLASMLERTGLKAAQPTGYFQPVPLVTAALGSPNRLEASKEPIMAGTTTPVDDWSPGEDYYPVPGSPSGSAEGPLAFAGYGVVDSRTGQDDFAGLDLSGRIVMVLDPRAQDEERSPEAAWLTSPHASIPEKARQAAVRGATGLIVVSKARKLKGLRTAWPDRPSVRAAQYWLARDRAAIPVVRVGAAAAETLLGQDSLAGTPRSIDDLFDQPGPGFEVAGRRAHVRIEITERTLTVSNVVAFLEGRDPQRRQELVVVAAHLDHDGMDEDGRIYNGADDDGSGSVAVLEIAEALGRAAREGQVPRRSVAVALWNAEEKGLLGSRHYVANVVPAGYRPIANVNLDMVGRHEEVPDANESRFRGLPRRSASETRSLVHALGYTFSGDLAAVAREEAPRLGLRLTTEYDPLPLDLLRRSDHWSFLVARVPALFFTTGLHPDYHTPDDDVDRIDFGKLQRVARLAFRLAWRVADAEEAPRFDAPDAAQER